MSKEEKIEVKITYSKSGNTITGVSIFVNAGKVIEVTDVDGNFKITLDQGKNTTLNYRLLDMLLRKWLM